MHRRYTPTPRRIIRYWRAPTRDSTVWFKHMSRMNRWVDFQASVHPVLKQIFWRVSVCFKCNRQIDRWSRHRIVRCWRGVALTLTIAKPKASDEPLHILSVHPMVCFDSFGHRTHPTNVNLMVSVHPTLWFEFQLVQFKRLWVFRRFFCFNLASMNSLSLITTWVCIFS
jgi:hypothetical protein